MWLQMIEKSNSKGGNGVVPMVDYGFHGQYTQQWV